eukprot:TRINITY_DN3374_c0_g1_i1.p1 TRINITY_DN3374_c0_g1~~TRINITY_DN3374_c0_g1_i1.p1  ORF type:complete len:158 (-),score=27.70 TRINITY_DN3374_c0_g1_i1:25-498(-)
MSNKRFPVVTGPLSSSLFKLIFIYLEPLACLGIGYQAITTPSEFISQYLGVTSTDAVAHLCTSALGIMLIVFGLLMYFGLKHGTVRGRFWIIFSLLVGDLLTIGGSLQVLHQFPGKPFFMGYNVTIVASIGLALIRSTFLLLAIWYEGNNLDRVKTH